MHRVLALDIASCTGWAADRPSRSESDKPVCGSFRVRAEGDDLGAAFVEFEENLEGLIGLHEPNVLAFEAPLVFGGRGGSTVQTNHQTVRILFGLAALAELVGTRAGLAVYELHIQAVRKHFVGNGRAQKSDVLARCRLLGWNPPGLDAADACACWDFARHSLRVPGAGSSAPLLARTA